MKKYVPIPRELEVYFVDPEALRVGSSASDIFHNQAPERCLDHVEFDCMTEEWVWYQNDYRGYGRVIFDDDCLVIDTDSGEFELTSLSILEKVYQRKDEEI